MKYGFRPDPAGYPHDGAALALYALAVNTTLGCLSRASSVVLFQGQAGSCVAHAEEEAFFDRALCQRIEKPRRGSRLWTYRIAREAERDGAENRDDGSRPMLAVEARRVRGVCAEDFWPYSDARVFDAPPLEAMQHAYDQRGTGTAHRCSDDPAQRERDIRGSIDADFPVIVGLLVDAAFESYTGGLWTSTGPALGGHMLEVVGYDTDGVWVRNSWGETWGCAPPDWPTAWVDDAGAPSSKPSGGFGHIAWADIRNPDVCSDAYAIQWTASYSEDVPNG